MRRTAVTFLDMLFNMLLIFFLMINPEATNADVKLAADYRLSVEWPGPEVRSDDIDVYVLSPTKGILFFRNRDLQGMVTLERDDLGHRNDISLYNREEVQFRSPEDGRYFVSVHNYRQDPQPFSGLRVHFEMVDQAGKVVFNGAVPMPPHHGEEIVGSFVVKDGKIVSGLGDGKPIKGRVLR